MTQTTHKTAPRLESPGPRQPFLLAALKSAGAVLLLEGTQLFVFFAGLVLLEISYGGEEATSRYYAWSNELAFLAAGFILLTVALIYIFRRRSFSDATGFRGCRPVQLIASPFLGGGAFLIAGGIMMILLLLPDVSQSSEVYHEQLDLTESAIGQYGWSGAEILYTVVGAPVIEEFVCRGLVLRQLRRSVPDWTAILLTALTFGLIHGNLYQLSFTIPLGILLGYVAVRANSILPAILLHAAFNASNYLPDLFEAAGLNEDMATDLCYAVFALCLIVGVTLTAVSTWGKPRLTLPVSDRERRIDWVRLSDGETAPFYQRSVPGCILSSVFTLGLFRIYWYCIAVKNLRALKRNKASCVKETLCLLFVPFYAPYWWYTRGQKAGPLFSAESRKAPGSPVLFLVLSLAGLDVVPLAILQSAFNDLPSQATQYHRLSDGPLHYSAPEPDPNTEGDSMAAPEFIVAGLGNPGEKYAATRHNAGFIALDYIALREDLNFNRIRFRAMTAEREIDGHKVLFMKPQTFMNLSGESVREAAAYYHIPPEKILVLVDDVNFEPGVIRIRREGSAGGHNGLKSIIECLGTEAFPRVRLGVGRLPEGRDLVGWVLSPLPDGDMDKLLGVLENVRKTVPFFLANELDGAMSLFNGKS